MPKVTVGGVPEHFNLPWYTAVENKEFEAAGVQVDFEEVPGGTGAMMSALREGKIDIVVALTEGIISNIINDDKREEQPVGVSRMGSGSHLMSFLLA
ncbi:unnamed protein product, partial [Symbiodinium sp. KB8]